MGGVALLKAVGFAKQADGSLLLPLEARDLALVAETRAKLTAAMEQYA